MMSDKAPTILRGFNAWRWYAHYLRDPVSCVSLVRERYGSVLALGSPFSFSPRGRHFVYAFGAEANRHVLGHPDMFRPGGQVIRGPRGSAHLRLRNGLLAMHGDEHRRQRRIMQPPFSRAAVHSHVPAMARLIDHAIDQWPVGEPFDMTEEMLALANWVAASLLFGHDDFDRALEVCQLIREWVSLDVAVRTLKFRPALPGDSFRKLLRHAEVVERAMLGLIREKRAEAEPGSDVLSILVHATDTDGSKLSDADLTAHTVILHGAAFITTASALVWTMYLIAQHPGIAAALDAEVEATLGDWPPTIQQLGAMPLLEGVILESMRILPPVHHTYRTATAPTAVLGVPLNAGDRVILSAFATHRDPDVFPDPDRFDPARWVAGNRPGPYEYIPFSAGPRLCLGFAFAMQEMKMIVARVVQRYRLAVVEGSHIDAVYRLTFSPKGSVPMTIHPRDGAYRSAPVSGNIREFVRHD